MGILQAVTARRKTGSGEGFCNVDKCGLRHRSCEALNEELRSRFFKVSEPRPCSALNRELNIGVVLKREKRVP